MEKFEFRTVPCIVVEAGVTDRLGPLLRDHFECTRLCLVTDAFLHKSGLLSKALASLTSAGWQVQVIDHVVADPPEHVVLEAVELRSEEHTSELQSLMRISYAVFCLKKKK